MTITGIRFIVGALASLSLVGCGPNSDPAVYSAAFERCMELAEQSTRPVARISLSPTDECERYAYNFARMEANYRDEE